MEESKLENNASARLVNQPIITRAARDGLYWDLQKIVQDTPRFIAETAFFH